MSIYREGRNDKTHDYLAAAVVGWCAAAAGRVVFYSLASALSGSAHWLLKSLSLPGWIPTFLWGGLAGLAARRLHAYDARWRRRTIITLCVMLFLIHDSLWSSPAFLRPDMGFGRLKLLFTTEFYVQTWPVWVVWFCTAGASLYLLPYWMRQLHEQILGRLSARQEGRR